MLRQVERILTERSAWWVKTHGDAMQRRGIPDLFVCIDGRFVGLEGKQKGEHPTPLQRYTLDQIKKAGGIAEVVRSSTDVEAILRTME